MHALEISHIPTDTEDKLSMEILIRIIKSPDFILQIELIHIGRHNLLSPLSTYFRSPLIKFPI